MHPMEIGLDEFFMFSFVIAVIAFIVVYSIIRVITVIYLLFKKKPWKDDTRAFYITIKLFLASNICAFIIAAMSILLGQDFSIIGEAIGIAFVISLGTMPFFIIFLLTWLSIKAPQDDVKEEKEKLEIGKTGEDWLR